MPNEPMTREQLREMGLLDFFLALCREEHVLLDALLGPKVSPALSRARVRAYVYLETVGLGQSEIGRIFDRDPSTVCQALRRAKASNVVPIKAAQ